MAAMRAKFRITSVSKFGTEGQPGAQETLQMHAVSKKEGYSDDGLDEDNTYAKFSPQGSLSLTIANPALLGKFKQDEVYYLDFTKAEK